MAHVTATARSFSSHGSHVLVCAPSEDKMSGLVAQGRPPTGSLWGVKSATPLQARAKRSQSSSALELSRLKKTSQHLWKLKSEPGLAEKAIEIASEVLDTDLTEVIETVQTTATDAAVTTQAAFQVSKRIIASIIWSYGPLPPSFWVVPQRRQEAIRVTSMIQALEYSLWAFVLTASTVLVNILGAWFYSYLCFTFS